MPGVALDMPIRFTWHNMWLSGRSRVFNDS